jgi:hypothetical protein
LIGVTRTELPGFSVDEYARLLDDLASAGYALRSVEAMESPSPSRVAYLRHDVDLHVPGIDAIAKVERERRISATYFVPIALHFNPAYPENRDVLRALVADGHRIGLHYDLRTYPLEPEATWDHLDWEVDTLSRIVTAPVRSICMHFPWGGREDLPRETTRYVHPHADRFSDVVYVSDSCRAWRDETLLRCFGSDAPGRLLLNTHPELWLGDATESRYDFLSATLMANTVRQHRAYLTDEMEPAWRDHPAPLAHDVRERRRKLERR